MHRRENLIPGRKPTPSSSNLQTKRRNTINYLFKGQLWDQFFCLIEEWLKNDRDRLKSGKTGWKLRKWNRLFRSQKISRSKGTSEKVVLFSRSENHYPDLGRPSDGWSKSSTWHDQSEALPRSGKWYVISMEFLCFFIWRHLEGKPLVHGVSKCRQSTQAPIRQVLCQVKGVITCPAVCLPGLVY